MKLRYGQVAMKILRYGPIGETRAESPATGPASLNKYKKERPKPLLIFVYDFSGAGKIHTIM